MGVTTTTRPARRRDVRPTVLRAPAPERVRSCTLSPSERAMPVALGESPIRLTRRGRLVLSVGVALVAAVLVALAGLAVLRVAPAADAAVPERTTTVMLEPGETVWQVARRSAPGEDTRAVVDQILRLNDIHDAGAIQAGTELRVPVSR